MKATTASSLAVLLAAAAAAAAAAAPAPAAFGVHLMLGGPGAMSVSWSAHSPKLPGVVAYGTDPRAPALRSAPAEVRVAGNITWGYHALLDGLSPGRRYYYSVPGEAAPASPADRSFVMPGGPASDGSFTAAVVGDMGVTGSENTTAAMARRLGDYELVLHIGDFAYADDAKSVAEYEATWDEWTRQVEPIAAVRPYATALGNHDVACRFSGDFGCPAVYDNATVYRGRFTTPHLASNSSTMMWYSFDYGLAHFVFIDTETSYPGAPEGVGTPYNTGPFGDQLAWLKADLERANLPENRAARPWLIVSGHRPFYSSQLVDWPLNALELVRGAFEPLMLANKVDLYLSGHVHAFEANYPAANGAVVQRNFSSPAAPVNVVNGAAGNIENHTSHWRTDKVPWLAHRNAKNFGYALMEVHNRTALTYAFHRADTDAVDYSFTVTK